MPSRHQKQISCYLYEEDIPVFLDTVTTLRTSSSRFVREAVLHVLNSSHALEEVSAACKPTQYRQNTKKK